MKNATKFKFVSSKESNLSLFNAPIKFQGMKNMFARSAKAPAPVIWAELALIYI
jgi:hypothetical protein